VWIEICQGPGAQQLNLYPLITSKSTSVLEVMLLPGALWLDFPPSKPCALRMERSVAFLSQASCTGKNSLNAANPLKGLPWRANHPPHASQRA